LTQIRQQSGNTPRPRAATRINPKLEKKLGMYLASASAAGVGLMALSNTAEAKVVYTPANITILINSAQPIDINGDGVTDATIDFYVGGKSFQMIAVVPTGNGIRVNASSEAAAGFFGVPIGPGEKFAKSFAPMYYKIFGYGNSSSYGAFGPWVNVPNRYLGVKLVIAGQTHYGWVRMTTGKNDIPVITGYAYETTPNTSIKDGVISGATVRAAEALEPTSLGLLAAGARGLSSWRHKSSGN
jgi:hypothetical protein